MFYLKIYFPFRCACACACACACIILNLSLRCSSNCCVLLLLSNNSISRSLNNIIIIVFMSHRACSEFGMLRSFMMYLMYILIHCDPSCYQTYLHCKLLLLPAIQEISSMVNKNSAECPFHSKLSLHLIECAAI